MARAADTLKRLVRVEDLIARADDNTLVAVLTDTPGDRSLKALHRIAGSLATTDYGLAGLPTAPIWMQMGHASLEPSDTADSLLLRARQICFERSRLRRRRRLRGECRARHIGKDAADFRRCADGNPGKAGHSNPTSWIAADEFRCKAAHGGNLRRTGWRPAPAEPVVDEE
ncbi:hypothetical protein ACFQ4K_01145 [Tistrella bauzanensis]